MEVTKPITLKHRPKKCPICGGEVWTLVYGEPTPEAYEERFKNKTFFAGCCITDHDPTWLCYDCHTPIYKGGKESEHPSMAYATCIIRHENLLPITQTVIHIAYDTKHDKHAARGFVRTYYGDCVDEYTLRVNKEDVRQLFSARNITLLEDASKITEFPFILDGATMWLRIECAGKVCTIEHNSDNVDIDNSMTLFLQQMNKLHKRWHKEEGYGIYI